MTAAGFRFGFAWPIIGMPIRRNTRKILTSTQTKLAREFNANRTSRTHTRMCINTTQIISKLKNIKAFTESRVRIGTH